MSKLREILLNELSSNSAARRRIAVQKLLFQKDFSETQRERLETLANLETDPETRSILNRIIESPALSFADPDDGVFEESSSEKMEIFSALLSTPDPSQRAKFRKLLESATKPETIIQLLEKIGDLADKEETPILLNLLGHEWSGIRAKALAILSRRDQQSLLNYLPELLKSPDVRIRLEAILALNKLLPEEARRLLRNSLGSDDPEERMMALHAAFTFDFNQISLEILKILLQETDREALKLAGLLAVTNPDIELAIQLYSLAEKVEMDRSTFLKNVAISIVKSSQLAELLSSKTPAEEVLKKLIEERTGKKTHLKNQLGQTTPVTPIPTDSPSPPRENLLELQQKLDSKNPAIVLHAIEELKRCAPDFLVLGLQKLLRHEDPRIRLSAEIFSEKLDPPGLQRDLKLLLESPDLNTRKEGIRLAFLMEPELAVPILIERLDFETDENITKSFELLFETNPSLNLLKALIIKTAKRARGKVFDTPLINRVYNSIGLISPLPPPPLKELLEIFSPSEPAENPEIARLFTLVKKIRPPTAKGSFWLELTQGVKETFRENLISTFGFFGLIIALVFCGKFFIPSVQPSANLKNEVPIPIEPVILAGEVVLIGKDQKFFVLKTSHEKFRVWGNDFKDLKKDKSVRLLARRKKFQVFGLESYEFINWDRPGKPGESGPIGILEIK